MFNNDGITKTTYGAPKQILANVELQSSVGCIVPQTMGVTVGTRKIVKAGTPIKINLLNLQTVAVAADGTTNAMNAVLLHDVDVTGGNKNGTACYFGIINENRVESDVVTLITTALTNAGVSKNLIFLKA